MASKKGAGLEELVRAYFSRQGFFALRSVSVRFEDEEVTDIDVWLYGRQSASVRTRAIVDVKDKRSPKAFERVLWTRGMQLALNCDRALVATTDVNPKVARFAQQQRVALLTKGFLDRLQKNVPVSDRLSLEDFVGFIQQNPNQKQDGDWVRHLIEAKSAVASLAGFPAFNRAVSSFRFFAERCETRPQHREQALRAAFLCAALACVALDAALERTVYDDYQTRYNVIESGVVYGDSGDARVQNSISTVLSVISTGMENGRVLAKQIEGAFGDLFSSLRASIIAEFFAREQNAGQLFGVARELDERAHATAREKLHDLSVEAKSTLGVFADFVGVKRSALFNGSAAPSLESRTEHKESTRQVRLI